MDWNFRQGEHKYLRGREGQFRAIRQVLFPRTLTNIDSRKNRTLKVLPPHHKEILHLFHLIAPEEEYQFHLNSSLRLVANASDPNGGLKGVQFYANQETFYSWSGRLEFNGSNLPADGRSFDHRRWIG